MSQDNTIINYGITDVEGFEEKQRQNEEADVEVRRTLERYVQDLRSRLAAKKRRERAEKILKKD